MDQPKTSRLLKNVCICVCCGSQHISVSECWWPMGYGILNPYERESKNMNSQLSLLPAPSEINLNVYNASEPKL